MREHDLSYLLRVWSDGESEGAWRASIRDLRTRETTYFPSLPGLLTFIRTIGERAGETRETEDPEA